jgi:integrase
MLASERTFRAVTAAYLASPKGLKMGEATLAEWKANLVRYAEPVIGDMPVDTIHEDHFAKMLGPNWSKLAVMGKVRARCEAILSYAGTLRYRAGENPARLSAILDILGPQDIPKKPHPALPIALLTEFMADLRGVDAPAARALRFLILTGVRAGAILGNDKKKKIGPGITWNEIDLTKKVWRIPGRRVKGEEGKRYDFEVPLSPEAIACLGPPGEGLVFGRLSEKPMITLCQRLAVAVAAKLGYDWQADPMTGVDPKTTSVHGFRAVMTSWARDAGFPHEVYDAALAHVPGGKSGTAVSSYTYLSQFLDARRPMMLAWGSRCAGAEYVLTSNVVALKRA